MFFFSMHCVLPAAARFLRNKKRAAFFTPPTYRAPAAGGGAASFTWLLRTAADSRAVGCRTPDGCVSGVRVLCVCVSLASVLEQRYICTRRGNCIYTLYAPLLCFCSRPRRPCLRSDIVAVGDV